MRRGHRLIVRTGIRTLLFVRVGIVSAGAMGSAVGRALRTGGASVATTLAGRSERTARLAHEAGLEPLPDLDAVVATADVVLSIAPPEQAEAIAATLAAACTRTGAAPLVADLNAISPATGRRIEAAFSTVGLELVDGSISGPPPNDPGTTRIYLSGPRATDVAALPFAGVDVIQVGDQVGTASAVKMCTASIYKGSIALLTHALLTAQANGILEHVLRDLGERADGAARSIARSATKSGRYVGEMREIAATQAAAGLTPALFEAMGEVYAALARTALARGAPEDVDPGVELDRVLRDVAPEPGR
jgi:3-hydroxyisobutyrate dehydrogenase-like beta-hydroxyacid dehydrogenase